MNSGDVYHFRSAGKKGLPHYCLYLCDIDGMALLSVVTTSPVGAVSTPGCQKFEKYYYHLQPSMDGCAFTVPCWVDFTSEGFKRIPVSELIKTVWQNDGEINMSEKKCISGSLLHSILECATGCIDLTEEEETQIALCLTRLINKYS